MKAHLGGYHRPPQARRGKEVLHLQLQGQKPGQKIQQLAALLSIRAEAFPWTPGGGRMGGGEVGAGEGLGSGW